MRGTGLSSRLSDEEDDEKDWDQACTGQLGPLVQLVLLFNLVEDQMLLNFLLILMTFFSRTWWWISF